MLRLRTSASLVPLVLLVLLFAGGAVGAQTSAATGGGGAVDPDLLAGLEARAIGPAAMSGRVVALAGVSGDPATIYVGAASGGLWRSTDGAVTWEPLFDDQPAASIGAIAVDPTAPDVLWVGTGEPTPRNSASVGNGVYRSRDRGETWELLGLETTEKIARILLDPRDTETAWVCALGTTWAESPDRGVYKTTDGGATWEKVLYLDRNTGCADLALDPSNPNKLFAAMWQHRRWPWFFRSGGPSSGLWRTLDGGETWKEIGPEEGLPKGELGRIGIAVAPSDPDRVYALVEAEENAFYASTDGGRTFAKRSSHHLIGNRPFYYSRIDVDPSDPDRVYSSWSLLSVSDDGGRTWRVLAGWGDAHPDHHALWIDPEDPSFVVDGNDGGVYVSRDRGGSWQFVPNLPFAQLYHVRVDDAVPYNVYFGLQDNGSWRGPAEVWEWGGIRNHHWLEVAFGDGFDTAPMPDDPTRGYAMSQEGFLVRWDAETGEGKDLRPAPPAEVEEELRFNWNAAFAQDPFDPATIYFGSQYVHRSTDRGDTWETISPDLTTDRAEWQRQARSGGLTPDVTGAENFTSIVALEPSPVERGVLWAGTDDGRLHVTRDGGGTWTSVEGNVRGVPAHTWIPHVHASHHDAGTAFVVFDNHRRFDWTPYVYRTTDYGRTWQSLATRDIRGYALSVLQDPEDPELLWVGTEFGLWVSLDGGGSWLQWTHGVPTVSVMDLAFQDREDDLVLGTHGRGVFVLDDVSPLRDLGPEVLGSPLHVFPVAAAVAQEVARGGSSRFPGNGEFRGENEPYGALVTFWADQEGLPHPDEELETERKRREREEARLAAAARPFLEIEEGPLPPGGETGEEPEEDPGAEDEDEAEEGEGRAGGDGPPPKAEVEVTDASGTVVRSFETPIHRGLNRFAWELSRDAFERPQRGEEPPDPNAAGIQVPPGRYTVTVRYGGEEASAPVEVRPDPRFDIPAADREAKYAAELEAGELIEGLTEAIERIRETRRDVERVRAKLADRDDDENGGEEDGGEEETSPEAELKKAAGELLEGLDELEKELWTPEDAKGIQAGEDAWSRVSRALWLLGSSWEAPTAAQLAYLERGRRAAEAALAEVDRFYAEEVAPFRERVEEAGVALLAIDRGE